MTQELEFKQDQRDRSAWSIHDRDLATRLVVDAIELAKRVQSVDPPIEDPVSAKQSNYITLDDYQKSALLTANTARLHRDQVLNAVLGLGGETGEVIEVLEEAARSLAIKSSKVLDDLKKRYFHTWSEDHIDNPDSFQRIREKIGKELGDMQWYIAVLAYLFDYTLGEIGKINREKLIERHAAMHTKTDGAVEPTPDVEIYEHAGGKSKRVFRRTADKEKRERLDSNQPLHHRLR